MAKRSRSASSMDWFAGRLWCEMIGTAMLVLIGCSAIVLSGYGFTPAGALQVGTAFGLAATAVIYSFGVASGGHINPAVSVAMAAAGRMSWMEALAYIVYQVVGAVIGAGILYLILKGKVPPGATTALGQNVMGAGQTVWTVLGVEFVATVIFALVFLGATAARGGPAIAGLIIGLTLVALHLAFISVDGLSVNPARSIGPAFWVGGGAAVDQLWMFILAPLVGGFVAGWLHQQKWLG